MSLAVTSLRRGNSGCSTTLALGDRRWRDGGKTKNALLTDLRPFEFEYCCLSFDAIPHLAVGQGRYLQELRQRTGVHAQGLFGSG